VTGSGPYTAQTARTHALQKLLEAHPDLLFLNQDHCFIARRIRKSGKVAIVSGGGAGHEPLHTGYVGHGMLDAACAGHFFSSPTPDQIAAAANHAECGQGVLFVVKNYQGDVLNFQLAAKLCPFPTATVLVSDDIATQEAELGGGRGLAGTIMVEKIIGAAAEAGLSLRELKQLGDAVNAETVTYGVALSSCRVPGAARPIYELEHGFMEIGVGIHGERGRERIRAGGAAKIAALLVERVSAGFARRNSNTLMIVNGLGGTQQAELEELASACLDLLARRAIKPARTLLGNYVTALDTHGFSLTLAGLSADWLQLWDAPVHTAALNWQ
jgi:phosphoenolpyruvate---glycerone phosphotransferase subunit DhaK